MLGKTIGYMYGLSLGKYDGTVTRFLEGSTEEIVEGIFEGLLLGD